jgi:hypothetical protein
MSASQCVQTHLGQTPVQNFALRHPTLNCPGHIFDRYIRIDTVLVQEIDCFDPKSLERCLADLPDVLGATIEAVSSAVRIDPESKLRGNHNLVT